MRSFFLFAFSGTTVCFYAVENRDLRQFFFVLGRMVAIIVQLVSFRYTSVSMDPSSVRVSNMSKNTILPFFSFSMVNMMPSVMLLMVLNKSSMYCILTTGHISSTYVSQILRWRCC